MIHTEGMAPTVVSGDLVWVSFGAAVPGDVVQARMDEAESPQLARVVAGPGSVVEVSAGVLYVDGQPLSRGGPHIMETCDGQRIRAIAEQWGGVRSGWSPVRIWRQRAFQRGMFG